MKELGAEHQPHTEAGTLLLECLALENGDRRTRLEALCTKHPKQAAAIRRLYESLDRLGFVDEPTVDAPLPERFGPYRVLRHLGSGGMGAVYLAEHDVLGRRVALKVLHATLLHRDHARERFRREALATSQLDHPHICPVHDVGEADGVPFLAMRYVPGEPLDRVIARSAASGAAVAELPRASERSDTEPQAALLFFIETAARALHVAHEAGLVHRDVKPGNLIVMPDGEPVLLDFGLARLEEGDEPSLTLSGDRLGTPLYMAPEQVAGVGAPADRRTDVYSLGVLLYECLTLHPPFEAVNRQSLFQQILREDPPDPRKRDRQVGRDLWTVLQTAMAKEPDRRYRTAQAFAEDLHRVRCCEPIAARRAGPLLRLRRFAQRNPLVATFLVFLAAALIGAAFLLQSREVALTTARAVGLARRAAEIGADAPQLGLHLALQAVLEEPNLETVSELYTALIRSRERRRLEHDAAVWGAEFSPDGELILTWSDDRTARLWDREGHRVGLEMRGDRPINWAEFSPDGERIVTSCKDGVAKVWNLQGRLLVELNHATPESKPAIWWAGFSPDGKRILTTCDGRKCYVWDSHTGRRIGEPFARHRGELGFGAWSPSDPDLVAAAVDYGQMRPDTERFDVLMWHPSTREVQAEIDDHGGSVHWLEFAPDGQSLLTASSDETARIWGLDGAELVRFEGHQGMVMHARFSPDGEQVVTAAEDGGVRLWDRSGALLATARHDGQVFDARFVRDGERILTASWDKSARLFDRDLRELVAFRGHGDLVWSANRSPDGKQVVTASWDHTARIWDLQDSDMPRLFHGGRVTALALKPDGTLASVSDDRTLRLTDPITLTGNPVPIAPCPTTLRLSPDGRKALVGHVDAICRLYDLEDAGPITEFRVPGSPGSAAVFAGDGGIITGGRGGHLLAWNSDGERTGDMGEPHRDRAFALDTASHVGLLVSSGWDREIKIRSMDGSIRNRWPAHEDWVNAVAISPQTDRIASASNDQTVAIWTLEGEKLQRLRGHDGKVLAVAWSPDGDLLASGASDGTACLWRTSDGKRLAVLRGHKGVVNAVLFTPDGRLWTAGDDGAIQAWPVPRGATTFDALAGALIQLAKDRKVQELTADEQERFDRVLAGR